MTTDKQARRERATDFLLGKYGQDEGTGEVGVLLSDAVMIGWLNTFGAQEAALAREAALKEAAVSLSPWLRHDKECGTADGKCDCGLETALRATAGADTKR